MYYPSNIENIELRINNPAEKIEMFAHSGECKYCGGIVKMYREGKTPFKIQPNNCRCLICGQPYYVEIKGSIEEWELEQWKQKGVKFAMEEY